MRSARLRNSPGKSSEITAAGHLVCSAVSARTRQQPRIFNKGGALCTSQGEGNAETYRRGSAVNRNVYRDVGGLLARHAAYRSSLNTRMRERSGTSQEQQITRRVHQHIKRGWMSSLWSRGSPNPVFRVERSRHPRRRVVGRSRS